MNVDWKSRYDLAVTAARAGGDFALTHFDRGVAVEYKGDNSPVTVADRGAEQLVREQISKHFPHDGFLGEEYGHQAGTSGFRWVIDPIDGTKSFVRGVPVWATLIGLEYGDEQIAGACYIPAMNLMYRALRGDGAYRNESRIRVSDVDTLERSMLVYSSINWFRKHGREKAFLDLYTLTERQRGYGDFYGFVLVAQGSAEVMVEHGVSPWDVAATKAIVEEAGGTFTDWDGTPTIHRPDVVASNGKVHAATLAALR